jgi:hypothetical protein
MVLTETMVSATHFYEEIVSVLTELIHPRDCRELDFAQDRIPEHFREDILDDLGAFCLNKVESDRRVDHSHGSCRVMSYL